MYILSLLHETHLSIVFLRRQCRNKPRPSHGSELTRFLKFSTTSARDVMYLLRAVHISRRSYHFIGEHYLRARRQGRAPYYTTAFSRRVWHAPDAALMAAWAIPWAEISSAKISMPQCPCIDDVVLWLRGHRDEKPVYLLSATRR